MPIDQKELARRNPGIDWDFIKRAEAFVEKLKAAGISVEPAKYSLAPPFGDSKPSEQQLQRERAMLRNSISK